MIISVPFGYAMGLSEPAKHQTSHTMQQKFLFIMHIIEMMLNSLFGASKLSMCCLSVCQNDCLSLAKG
jgi:hypothetical protein